MRMVAKVRMPVAGWIYTLAQTDQVGAKMLFKLFF